VSESGWTPISEKSAATCSSVALNDKFPTYNFFTVVSFFPGDCQGSNAKLKRQDPGSDGQLWFSHSQLKRALQQLRSILRQVTPAVNNRLRGEGCFGRSALSAAESGGIRQNFEEEGMRAETTCAER
jgi:hypothetical protein